MAVSPAFFAMSYIVVLNPLVIGTGADSAGNTLGVPQVAAVTALVAGVMTILMGVIAKQPFAMAAGLGVNALLASTIATTPGLTWADIMGLVIIAGLIMTVLVLTGFRTAVFEASPRASKPRSWRESASLSPLSGWLIPGLSAACRMPQEPPFPSRSGWAVTWLGWPTLVFIFGLFLTIALFIRNVRGAILIGVVASTALSIIPRGRFPYRQRQGKSDRLVAQRSPRSIIFSFSAPRFLAYRGLHDSARSALLACWAHPCWCSLFCSRSSSTPWGVSVGLATRSGHHR